MAAKTISKCAACGYPITAEYEGQKASCPMCGTVNEAISGVTIPTWMFSGAIFLVIGIIAGPAIIGSTDEGARKLERMARAKLSGK